MAVTPQGNVVNIPAQLKNKKMSQQARNIPLQQQVMVIDNSSVKIEQEEDEMIIEEIVNLPDDQTSTIKEEGNYSDDDVPLSNIGNNTCSNTTTIKAEAIDDSDQYFVHSDTVSCHICDAVLPSQAALVTHAQYHYPHSSQRFSCSKCPRQFIDKDQIRNHIQSHVLTNENPTSFEKICENCGIHISTSSNCSQGVKLKEFISLFLGLIETGEVRNSYRFGVSMSIHIYITFYLPVAFV